MTHDDYLTVYIKNKRYDQDFNTNNVKRLLVCLEIFEKWSGLKINNGKTKVIVFGIKSCEPPL